jgi:chemosensory pili system protein ChpA (sensor histidine kinase/response regulator)
MQMEKELIREFVDRSRDYIQIIELDLLELEKGDFNVIHEIMRCILSMRTQSEILPIVSITDRIIQLQTNLRRIRDHHLNIDRELITLLFKAIDLLNLQIEKLDASFSINDSEIRQIEIQANPVFQTLESYIAVLLKPVQRFSEIESIFPLKSGAELAARDYGKKVEVFIEGQDVPIPKVILKRLPRLLTHFLNNAIAHGIESPEARIEKGKSEIGKIILKASYQDNKAVISFADDGAGIDTERVKNKAISKGLLNPQIAISLTDKEVFEFLFHPDFSTKDVRDMRAGTGYGLDIVRTEIKEVGGMIEVQSKIDQGTTFTMQYIQKN